MGAPGRAQAGEILKYRADQRKAEQESFNVASKRHEIYKQEMGALSSDPDLTKDKVIATFDNLVSNGLMPQTMRDTMVSKLPDDPVALKASALQDAKSTLKGKDLLTAFLPELMVAGGNVINKNPLAPGGAGAVIAPVAPVAERTDTDLIRNFNAAKAQGFTGNIFDYERKINESRRTPAPAPTPSAPVAVPKLAAPVEEAEEEEAPKQKPKAKAKPKVEEPEDTEEPVVRKTAEAPSIPVNKGMASIVAAWDTDD
jgi:hypothetical protein